MSETEKADPSIRLFAVVMVAAGTVIGGSLIALFQQFRPDLEGWVRQDLHARTTLVLTGMAIATSGPLLALAACLWRFGQQIGRARRYPAPGMRAARDTTVVTGEVALRRGRLIQMFGVLLGVMSAVLAFMVWRLASLL
jgi:hypothetical protein